MRLKWWLLATLLLAACSDSLNPEIVCAKACASMGYSYQSGNAFRPSVCMCGATAREDGGR